MTTPHDRDEDHASDVDDLVAATDRLLATLAHLHDDDLRGASLLPGWSRGHVLAHLARNADGLRNLVTWAGTGVETPMYVSRERRDADIERDAPRTLAEHHKDMADSVNALTADLRALPTDCLGVVVRTRPGQEFPAAEIAWRRLREVEIHHVDLDVGYTPEAWSAPFVERALGDAARNFARRSDVPAMSLCASDSGREWVIGSDSRPAISGPDRIVLAWLIGRADGTGLTVSPPGSLPRVPAWA